MNLEEPPFIVCQARPNGNTQLALALVKAFLTGLMRRGCVSMPMVLTVAWAQLSSSVPATTALRERLPLLAASNQMLSGSMICSEMFGSGWRTAGQKHI